jgi:hypothetical protein
VTPAAAPFSTAPLSSVQTTVPPKTAQQAASPEIDDAEHAETKTAADAEAKDAPEADTAQAKKQAIIQAAIERARLRRAGID